MRRLALVAAAMVIVAGCSEPPPSDVAAVLDALPRPEAEPAPTTTTSGPPSRSRRECDKGRLATRSLAPDEAMRAGELPAGGAVEEIRDRGYLVVGVDENTLGFASRDPRTGEIEGFEVELAREIARQIFGDADEGRVRTLPVVTDDKLEVVQDGVVDMTISANSMSCRRWEDVAFSSEYYTAHQEFLVRADSTIDQLGELAGATVCVTTQSSSIGLLEDHVPEAEPYPVRDRTGCLLALQEGEVDAYLGHDSFLYGMMAQDPNVEMLDLLDPADSVSNYGIAIAHGREDLVRFVNAVLEDVRTDGTWQKLHRRLERDLALPRASPPPAQYRAES